MPGCFSYCRKIRYNEPGFMQVENKSMKLATKVDSNSSRQSQQCKVSPQ